MTTHERARQCWTRMQQLDPRELSNYAVAFLESQFAQAIIDERVECARVMKIAAEKAAQALCEAADALRNRTKEAAP